MLRHWKLFIPGVFFFILSIGLLLYAFVLAPESEVTQEETLRVEKMFLGIPQKGSVLGNKKSKEAIIVFADLQCKFCAKFSKEGLPNLLPEVRSGKLKLDLRLLSALGPDSEKAARAAQALASQNKMWQFVELFYLNQGEMGSGYVSDSFIRQIYNAIGVNQDLVDASETKAAERVELDNNLAFRSGIRGTPAFIFVSRDGTIQPLAFAGFSKEEISKALAKVRGEQKR